jgi:hypothetical protein
VFQSFNYVLLLPAAQKHLSTLLFAVCFNKLLPTQYFAHRGPFEADFDDNAPPEPGGAKVAVSTLIGMAHDALLGNLKPDMQVCWGLVLFCL